MPDQIGSLKGRIPGFISMLVFLLCLTFSAWGNVHAAENKVFVLCYHSFLGNKPFPSDISVEEFRSQMNLLKGKGFRFVSYSDLVKGTVTGTQNILVVIDDGNRSVLDAYRYVMKPLGIKPMLAIYPNIIGKKSYAFTWEELKGLVREGCDIAAHGYYHMLMNQKFYDKDKTEFIHEITGSKELLEKNLGLKISAFVYPNGVRSDITKKTLKDSGYTYAFTINWGAVRSPLSSNKDLLELPRYMVLKNNWEMISSSIIKASAQ